MSVLRRVPEIDSHGLAGLLPIRPHFPTGLLTDAGTDTTPGTVPRVFRVMFHEWFITFRPTSLCAPVDPRVNRLAPGVVARQRGYSTNSRSHVAHPVKADSGGNGVAAVERMEHPSPGDPTNTRGLVHTNRP
jgi:hypothetical protein